MTLTAYPVGLLARTDYFRVVKSRWDQECKDFVLERMKASANNIKPVIVLDETSKLSECYFPNPRLTGFDLKTGLEADIMCRRVESIADWMINKVRIQKSNLTHEEKVDACDLCLKKYLNKKKLNLVETRKLKGIEARL